MVSPRLMPDDRRDPDAQLFRQLFDRLDELSGYVDKLADRIDKVGALIERVQHLQEEINRLREKADHSHDRLTLMEALHKVQQEQSQAGVVRVRPAVLAAVTGVLIALLTALVKAYEFIRGRP